MPYNLRFSTVFGQIPTVVTIISAVRNLILAIELSYNLVQKWKPMALR